MVSSVEPSACVRQSFEAVGSAADVTTLELAKAICEAHDPSGKEAPFAAIRAIEDDGAYLRDTPASWRRRLLDACSADVPVLHTSLALLLLARLDPELSDRLAGEVDTRLREGLWRPLADYTRSHEIRGHAEFLELVDNVRKWRPTDENMQGRTRTAVLYCADPDLDGWAGALARLEGHPYLGLRFRLPAADAAEVLSKELRRATAGPADTGGAYVERYTRSDDTSLVIGKALHEALPSEGSLDALVGSLQDALDRPGTRLVLFLELDPDPGGDVVEAAQQLGDGFANPESGQDRVIVVVGGVPHGASLDHPPGACVYRLAGSVALEDTGQTWKNDLAKGDDLLDIRQEAEALADGARLHREDHPAPVPRAGRRPRAAAALLPGEPGRRRGVRRGRRRRGRRAARRRGGAGRGCDDEHG